jgi:hypothetical protein
VQGVEPSATSQFEICARNVPGVNEESHENLSQNCQSLGQNLKFEIQMSVSNMVVNALAPLARRCGVPEAISCDIKRTFS